jgi:tight adherence protein C
MTTFLGPAWVLLLLVGAWWWRPPAARVRQLVLPPGLGPRPALAATAGRVIRHRLRRRPDPAADLRLGRVLLVGLPLALLWPPAGLTAALVCWAQPAWRARRDQRRAEAEVVRLLPDVVDLLGVAVAAGCTVPLALALVAPRVGGPLGVGLGEAVRRARLGERHADAVRAVCAEAGEVARPLVVAVQSAEHYGSPLVPALERLSAECRARRRRQAEVAARRTPVRLLFPLVLCTLPAFALLTVVPLLAGSLTSLRP